MAGIPKTADYDLPGLNVTVNDGGLRVSPPLVGPKLTILGTTSNTALPLNEPVSLTDHKLIGAVLDHPDGTPSEMSLAVGEAIRAGAQNIELVKISEDTGEDATYALEDRFDDLETALDIIKLTPIDVVYCPGAHVDETPTGTNPGGTVRTGFHYLLVDKIYQANKVGNTAIAVLGARAVLEVANDENWTGAPTTRAGELFDDVSATFIREYVYHLTADDQGEDHSAETDLDGFLRGSNEESPGVVDALYDLQAHEEDGSVATDQLGNNVDGGRFLSIVAMAAQVSHPDVSRLAVRLGQAGQTRMNTNGAGSYAGLITTLPPERAPTNRNIAGLISARQMAPGFAETLMEYRYVTALDRAKGYVVAAAVTAAHNAGIYTRSDFVNLTTVRITYAAIDQIRLAGEDFIGGPINPMSMASLKSAISAGLNRMKAHGALRRAAFDILVTPDMQVLGEVSVDLTIVPAFELRVIKVVTSLTKE